MSLLDIYIKLKKDLSFVEDELVKSIRSEHLMLNQTAAHLLKAGGKRIRPVFVLLAGKFGTYDLNRLVKIAVPLELIHMATLVHDDVIDDAETRRGKKTVKAHWNNQVAMITGDYIFAKSLVVISDLSEREPHQILSKAIVEMCLGELDQVRDFYRWNQSLRDYLRRIKRKTALLMAISCQLGALVTNADPKVVQALYRFGYHVGMAFQITDDILDLIGTEKELGKPAGSDLRQGNVTLPVLYALHSSADRDKVHQLTKQFAEEMKIDEMIAFVRQSGGIEYARRLADRYIHRAMEDLKELPDIPAKRDLVEISRFIGERNY